MSLSGGTVAVYVSSAGRRVELIRCFREAAGQLGLKPVVIAGDMQPALSAACHEADVAVAVPPCDSSEFPEAVMDVCRKHSVSLLVPTIDPELLVFSNLYEPFLKAGVRIAVSSPAVVSLARDKMATAAWMRAQGIRTPKTASIIEARKDPRLIRWPAIVRPISGSSSKGIYFANSALQLRDHGAEEEGYFVQSVEVGSEYTVNIFFDPGGALRAAVPHRRHEVRAGEVSKGETERHEGLIRVAHMLGDALVGARGALCFQAIVGADDQPAVFEINARFGGGYPLAQRAGAPFARWLLEECVTKDTSYEHSWKSGLRMLRYDAAIFTHG